MAPQFGVMEAHALPWPLKLGCWTPMLRHDPFRWDETLPRLGMAPLVGMMDSHALVWPLNLG